MKQETSNAKLRALVVCSANSGKVVPYIAEQLDAIQKQGLVVDYFLVKEKGLLGYLKARNSLMTKICEYKPDIIHAHYGLCGLLANLQGKVPVVTTYHGSDINNPRVRIFSKLSIKLSKYNIFVAQKLIELAKAKRNYMLLPCGVDLDLFRLQDKEECRKILGLDLDKQYILFSGSFTNAVKNYPLAKSAVEMLGNVELLELKGYTREQVACLMNAVDAVLMCSFSEGSPQFIKEAMACNCSIISTNVGDVVQHIDGLSGCFLVDATAESISQGIKQVLAFNLRTKGRERLLEYDNKIIARKIIAIYNTVLRK